jgi:Zn-dependent peptidase ImmA (M78 family)
MTRPERKAAVAESTLTTMVLIKQATADAERLLDTFWNKEPGKVPLPVDPVQIARDLGIQVFNARLDDDVAAALVKERGQDPTILLNQSDSRNRRRFSCGHELGHFVRRNADDYEYIDHRNVLASAGEDSEEIYANAFAASLLMPESEVRNHYESGLNEIEMAHIFAVSKDAMGYRLKNLGLEYGSAGSDRSF